MKERLAIYPGSFDPVTNGHISIIERAARMFPRLIVVVGYNPNKQTLFSVDDRMRFIRESVAHLKNVAVESFTSELLVDYARRAGASIVVRGLRGQADFHNEFAQSKMNEHLMPGLETVFLFSEAEDIYVSSTLVRDIIRAGGDFSAFVPPVVTDTLHNVKAPGSRDPEGVE